MDQDRITLLDRLTPLDLHLTDHLTHLPNEPTLSKPTLLGRMSLLDRMNIECCELNSRPSSPSIEIRNCPNPELSQGLVCSSTKTPPSPILKRKRPSTFTSRNSTPSTPHEIPDSSYAVQKRIRRWTSPSMKSSTKLLTKPDPEMTSRMTSTTLTSHRGRRGEPESAIWDGLTLTTPPPSLIMTAAGRLANTSRSTTKTSPVLNSSQNSTRTHLLESLLPSGSASSVEKRSTSTTSCLHSTGLQLMKRGRLTLETQRSALAYLTQNGVSVPPPNGPLPGIWHPEQLPSLSPTVLKNYETTATLSRPNLPANSSARTRGSSFSTSPSGILYREDRSPSSLTDPFTCDSIPLSLCQTELPPALLRAPIDDRANRACLEANQTCVTVSTPRTGVLPPMQTADTDISVRNARRAGMEGTNACSKSYAEILGARPRYLHYNLWYSDTCMTPTIAKWSKTATPLPAPPMAEIDDPIACQTILENPSLCKIVTPINVDHFQELLANHPNPLFVDSVCAGLHRGFWPWADTLKEGYPSIFDGARPTPSDNRKAAFIRDQRDIEIRKGRFSESFGPDLLPGMYCMPAHAVPKPNSSDLRMVTDHSASPYSLNSMVYHDQVTGYPLDNMTHMGEMLIAHHRLASDDRKTVVWKSDIAEPYPLATPALLVFLFLSIASSHGSRRTNVGSII